jgi:2-(1,2-epoxy-1,2-dihydrophenyl)acetyl-CoA isomerase
VETIVSETLDGVARIALNRPEQLNSLDLPLRQGLLGVLRRAASDEAVRAVILTGEGRAFCSGQDLGAAEELVDAGATVAESYNPIARCLREMDKPVVAAVNGLAVGAGMGLALCCDEIVMSEKAFFSCAFVRVGLVPDTGVTSALVRTLGHARAFELARTARRVGADEALALGLVNEVVAPEALEDAALTRARELAAGPALALALTKRLLVRAAHEELDVMLDLEAEAQGAAAAAPDHAEGVAAFDAKRPPVYTAPGRPPASLVRA